MLAVALILDQIKINQQALAMRTSDDCLIAMNDYLSLFKSYEFLNCTMFIYSNPTTPSTLNPDLIFHFYCGFDQTLGLAFNFDFGTDLDFDFNFKFQFHILTFQQDLAHI